MPGESNYFDTRILELRMCEVRVSLSLAAQFSAQRFHGGDDALA